MSETIEAVRCLFCNGSVVCIKVKYFCADCGQRSTVAEAHERHLQDSRVDKKKLVAAKEHFRKKVITKTTKVLRKKIVKRRSK